METRKDGDKKTNHPLAFPDVSMIMATMSAKRTDLNKDRHKGKKITLRFGGSAEQALREIARAEDRTMTTILSRALRLYAEKNGFTWPGPSNHGKE